LPGFCWLKKGYNVGACVRSARIPAISVSKIRSDMKYIVNSQHLNG